MELGAGLGPLRCDALKDRASGLFDRPNLNIGWPTQWTAHTATSLAYYRWDQCDSSAATTKVLSPHLGMTPPCSADYCYHKVHLYPHYTSTTTSTCSWSRLASCSSFCFPSAAESWTQALPSSHLLHAKTAQFHYTCVLINVLGLEYFQLTTLRWCSFLKIKLFLRKTRWY